MDLYSPTLGVAIAACALAVLAAGAAWLAARRAGPDAGRRLRLLARIAALASLALGSFSASYHLAAGHRPGTAEAMAASEFVRQHPAFAVTGVLAAISLLAVLRRPD